MNKHPYISVLEKISKIKLLRQKSVSLLAVTKKTNEDKIMELFKLGQREFGENYVDELIEKSKSLTKDINWYFIGHLQSNKVKKLLNINNLTTISSVDDLDLAKTINSNCEKLNRKIDIFIQVNISNEESKSGCKIIDLVKLYGEILKFCPNINLKGIMALGTLSCKSEFNLLWELKTKIAEEYCIPIDEILISNGTSGDYELAIELGSNQVRLGSVLIKDDDQEVILSEKLNEIKIETENDNDKKIS